MKRHLSPLLALGLGGISLLFWRWIWQVIYDPTTQLVSSSPLVGLLILFVLLCALIPLLLSRDRFRRPPGPGRTGWQPCVLRVASAALFLTAGGVMLSPLLAAPSPIPLVLAVLLLLNGPALCGLAVPSRLAGSWQQPLSLFPTFVSCFWLVAFYHQYGSSPSWITYLWPMLAQLVVIWGWLAYAGRFYQPRAWDLALPLALVALLLLTVSLGSLLSRGFRLSLAAQLFWFWSVPLEEDPAPQRKENSHV